MTKKSNSFTDANVLEVIEFKPKFTTELFMMNLYCNDGKYSAEVKQLQLKKAELLMPYLFFKEDAIKFNAKVMDEISVARRLNDDELERIIEKNYNEFPNGLYRYSEQNNDDNHSFYVTREELKAYLKNQIIFVNVVFKINIKVDGSKCLLFEKKDD